MNGWPIIAVGLKARGLLQKDLAARLRVSPPAVSQIKTGRIRLNARQLAAICEFLHLDDAMIRALYGEIVEARLGRRGASAFGEKGENEKNGAARSALKTECS